MTPGAQDPGSARRAAGVEVVVSTDGLPAGDASSAWGDAINARYCEVDLQVERRQQVFDGLLQAVPVGDLDFTWMRSSPHRVVRSPAMIRSDGHSEFLLCQVTRGAGVIHQDGRSCTLHDGSLTLLDCDRPFRFDLPEEFEQIIVRVPRAQLLARLPESAVAAVTAHTVAGHSGIGGVLSMLIQQVLRLDPGSMNRSATTLATSTVDLLLDAVTAGPVITGAAQRAHVQDLQRAKKVLRSGLHDAERTMDDVCLELGVSRRYLQTLFQKVGGTPSGWLREARLDRARHLLTTTRLTAEMVAERCGFKDYSHFHRTFKAHTGIPPGAFRIANSLPAEEPGAGPT